MTDLLIRAAELICDIEPSYGDCVPHETYAEGGDMHCRYGIPAAEGLRTAGLLTEPERGAS